MGTRDGIITKDSIHIFMLIDTSYSMINGKIDQVNSVMPTVKRNLIDISKDEGVDVMLHVLTFSDEAKWVIGSYDSGVAIEDVIWKDLRVDSCTNTAAAIKEVNKAISRKYLGDRGFKSVILLITDGYCNSEFQSEYLAEINNLKQKQSKNSGQEMTIRIGIGVGDYDKASLDAFATEGLINDEMQSLVLDVDKTDNLGKYIDWVTVSTIKSSITGEEVVDLGDEDWGDDDEDDADEEDKIA